MTTVTIDLSDEQAVALKARAMADGLTLEAWLQRLAAQEAPSGRKRYKLSELIEQCDTQSPLSAEGPGLHH